MHTVAWVAWVGLVMTVALTTNNPYYLAIVFLSVILVAVLAPRTATAVAGFRALLVFGLSLFAISLFIATINGTYGSHILVTIPGPEAPGWLGGLRLGGPVSAEGLVAAAIRGLAILCVLLAFGVFNGAVSPHRALRLAPAALFHAGLVVTVGLTLLPSSIEDMRRIREMRALRGARSGLRELPALVVPAVIGGLERSMRLAEAMEARGYAAGPAAPRGRQLVGVMALPLLVAATWGWYYYTWARPLAAAAATAGLVALAWWGWSAASARTTTRLHDEPMLAVDRIAALGSAALIVFTIVAAGTGWIDLKYNPYAGLEWPPFELLPAVVALTCAWPAARLVFASRVGEAAPDAAIPAEAVRA